MIVFPTDDCATTDPPMLDNASFEITAERAMAVYTCDAGYTGGSSLSCTAGFSWDPAMPTPCDREWIVINLFIIACMYDLHQIHAILYHLVQNPVWIFVGTSQIYTI